jgi:hypothetical protein
MTAPKKTQPRKLTVSKQPLSLMPVEVASAAGAARSGWLKTGNGAWAGWVIKKTDDGEQELTVEEVSVGWQVTDEDGHNVATGRELLDVLKKVLK